MGFNWSQNDSVEQRVCVIRLLALFAPHSDWLACTAGSAVCIRYL